MFKKLFLLVTTVLMGSNFVWAPTCEQNCDSDARTNAKGKRECKNLCKKARKADARYAKNSR